MNPKDLINKIEEIINQPTDKSLGKLENTESVDNLSNISEEPKNENLKKRSPFLGGHREGSGRKKGQYSKETLDRMRMERVMKERIVRATNKLLDSQMNLARGCQYLFKIKKVLNEKTGTYYIPKGTKSDIVKDRQEIADYLEGKFDQDETLAYYFITTDKPDSRALDSLLDRTYGRATQKVEGNIGLTMGQLLDNLEEI